MNLTARQWAALALGSSALLTGAAQAANFSLWINGRTGGGQAGDYTDFGYWGPASADAGVNKKAVNWDGYSHVSEQNYLVRNALDCFCTGKNWCYVAAHSAGDLMIGYTLAMYGGSTRVKQRPSPAADGTCSPSDGSSQVGWNIKWVDISAGAGGGSELANAGDWALDEPLVADLKTGTARAMYNHDETRGKLFSMYAGASGTLYSFVLPGEDDEVVAYHSSGGVSGNGGAAFCNPSDWLCNDLKMGTQKNEGGRAKWNNHSVVFRDDGERYNHYTNENWGGVTSLVRADMALNATAAVTAAGPPPAAATQAEQGAQRALWRARLQRAQQALDTYRTSTRYPPESQPLARYTDASEPDRPIVEELPLRLPGAPALPGLRLRTTQQRVYAQGDEQVRLTVAAVDEEGRVLPLQVSDAQAAEGATGGRAARGPTVPLRFTDDGQAGDRQAGDGVYSAVLQPARQGFAALDGLLRVSLRLQSGEQPGSAHFDVIYSPQAPAAWQPGVHESVADGSLNFDLALDVLEPGRYLASGRVFDANGRAVALLSFSDTLAAGPRRLRLPLFGKLLRDLQPAFPLTLRDVRAYLLRPDHFPDRALMPALHGTVHESAVYPLSRFSDAEWASEERSRHLAEFGQDVASIQRQIDALAPPQ